METSTRFQKNGKIIELMCRLPKGRICPWLHWNARFERFRIWFASRLLLDARFKFQRSAEPNANCIVFSAKGKAA